MIRVGAQTLSKIVGGDAREGAVLGTLTRACTDGLESSETQKPDA
jgi:hypothetical protein